MALRNEWLFGVPHGSLLGSFILLKHSLFLTVRLAVFFYSTFFFWFVKQLILFLFFSEGRPARFPDLLPEAGNVLLLEGPPGSGKTTAAHILVSSWTDGPKHAISNLVDLGFIDLLVYVDCSTVKGDLFEEITAQLSLSEKPSGELRTVLSGSSMTLLLLDGYKEGQHLFDETVRRFISERGSCRVLVTSCSGDCPTLKQTLGSGGILTLQAQCAKY